MVFATNLKLSGTNSGFKEMSNPSFSIVINTMNRGAFLKQTLESFRWLKYAGDFEVITVNGPSTDNSDEVIRSWLPAIRAARCEVANLSVSRNIGICMAQGDVVVFIDDDAIPEPEWLTQLAEPYADPAVGAVGGLVFNYTGYDFQYKYCLVDRFGNADLSVAGPTPHLCFPKSYRFPHLLGCNSSFRRSALLDIGGFDEEYDYFLDETDVCLRIIDAGYVIAQQPYAYVHHKVAPSNIRGENRVVSRRYPVIKNKIYFTLKHAREFHSLDRILQEQQSFIQSHRNDITWAVGEGLLSRDDLEVFSKDVDRALETGLRRGLEGVAAGAMITPEKIKRYEGEFQRFESVVTNSAKSIVLVSKDHPQTSVGGIATFTQDLAEALAAQGNIVHLITRSPDINRVDFVNGVWVHRVLQQEMPMPVSAQERLVPVHIWNWSATALAECRRISTHRSVDVVEAPIWDCEGIAFLLEGDWPLVTSLHTTLRFWMQSNPKYSANIDWMSSFGQPMLALETELMTSADAIRANSKAIIREIESAYDFKFDPHRTIVIPHGVSECTFDSVDRLSDDIEVLFVGRLEARKGIDALLTAIPSLLSSYGNVRFKIVGDDTLPGPDGVTYADRFRDQHEGAGWLSRVYFTGKVTDQVLQQAYAACDIFVAPSRFESFGLVFLEAMRVAKPVIGCRAGAMPEIIADVESGLLVPPGRASELATALAWMIDHPNERVRMGLAGRRLFETNFTSAKMAERSLGLYDLVAQRHRNVA